MSAYANARWGLFFLLIALVDANVLVLGSGGLIGSALVKWLKSNGFNTLEVVNRKHIDLRVPGALDVFNNSDVSFVFFLACEVGGAKFIHSSEKDAQRQIIENNILIYQTVFKWLDERKIPFIFTSSYLQGQPNAYGTIKRLGEAWMKTLGLGKVVRLWNIYGPERVGVKSHVLTDWVHACVSRGRISCLTDGREPRQFLHVNDTAAALGTMMLHYERMDLVTDISSNEWTTLRQLGELVTAEAPEPCSIEYSEQHAVMSEPLAPNTSSPLYGLWQPRVSLREGIRDLFAHFRRLKQREHQTTVRDEL